MKTNLQIAQELYNNPKDNQGDQFQQLLTLIKELNPEECSNFGNWVKNKEILKNNSCQEELIKETLLLSTGVDDQILNTLKSRRISIMESDNIATQRIGFIALNYAIKNTQKPLSFNGKYKTANNSEHLAQFYKPILESDLRQLSLAQLLSIEAIIKVFLKNKINKFSEIGVQTQSLDQIEHQYDYVQSLLSMHNLVTATSHISNIMLSSKESYKYLDRIGCMQTLDATKVSVTLGEKYTGIEPIDDNYILKAQGLATLFAQTMMTPSLTLTAIKLLSEFISIADKLKQEYQRIIYQNLDQKLLIYSEHTISRRNSDCCEIIPLICNLNNIESSQEIYSAFITLISKEKYTLSDLVKKNLRLDENQRNEMRIAASHCLKEDNIQILLNSIISLRNINILKDKELLTCSGLILKKLKDSPPQSGDIKLQEKILSIVEIAISINLIKDPTDAIYTYKAFAPFMSISQCIFLLPQLLCKEIQNEVIELMHELQDNITNPEEMCEGCIMLAGIFMEQTNPTGFFEACFQALIKGMNPEYIADIYQEVSNEYYDHENADHWIEQTRTSILKYIPIMNQIITSKDDAERVKEISKEIQAASILVLNSVDEYSPLWNQALTKISTTEGGNRSAYSLFIKQIEKSKQSVIPRFKQIQIRDLGSFSFTMKSLVYSSLEWLSEFKDFNWSQIRDKLLSLLRSNAFNEKCRPESLIEPIADNLYFQKQLNSESPNTEIVIKSKHIMKIIIDQLSHKDTFSDGITSLMMINSNIATCSGGIHHAISTTFSVLKRSAQENINDDRLQFCNIIESQLQQYREHISSSEESSIGLKNNHLFEGIIPEEGLTHASRVLNIVIGVEWGIRGPNEPPNFDQHCGLCSDFILNTSKQEMLSMVMSAYTYDKIEDLLLKTLNSQFKKSNKQNADTTYAIDNKKIQPKDILSYECLGYIRNIGGPDFNPQEHPEFFINPIKMPIDISDTSSYDDVMALDESDSYWSIQGINKLGLLHLMHRLGYISHEVSSTNSRSRRPKPQDKEPKRRKIDKTKSESYT